MVHWSYRAGIVTEEDVVRWADGIVAGQAGYFDDIVSISLSAGKSPQEIDSMLLHASTGADLNEAIRQVLGRMHRVMLEDRGRARGFARILEQFSIERVYRLPEDLHFIFGLDDEFCLAESGDYGTVEGVTDAFIAETEKYDQRTSACNATARKPRRG